MKKILFSLLLIGLVSTGSALSLDMNTDGSNLRFEGNNEYTVDFTVKQTFNNVVIEPERTTTPFSLTAELQGQTATSDSGLLHLDNVTVEPGTTYVITITPNENDKGLDFFDQNEANTPYEYPRFTLYPEGGPVMYGTEQFGVFNDTEVVKDVTEVYDDSYRLFDTDQDGATYSDISSELEGFENNNGTLNATSKDYRLEFQSFNVQNFTQLDIVAKVNENSSNNDSNPELRLEAYNSSDKTEVIHNETIRPLSSTNNLVSTSTLNSLLKSYNHTSLVIQGSNETGTDFKIQRIYAEGTLQEPLINVGLIQSAGDTAGGILSTIFGFFDAIIQGILGVFGL